MVSRDAFRSMIQSGISSGSGVYGSALIGGLKPGQAPKPPSDRKYDRVPGARVSDAEKIATIKAYYAREKHQNLTDAEAQQKIQQRNVAAARAKERKKAAQNAVYQARLQKFQTTNNGSLSLGQQRDIRQQAIAAWKQQNPSANNRTKLTPEQRQRLSQSSSYQAALRDFGAASKALFAARAATLG